ncbi:MAG TPA: carbohydrate kinase family protein [Thermoproteales archaeon]|nr:carbohydrate kinase family protein [Thermoproteales archaeon]
MTYVELLAVGDVEYSTLVTVKNFSTIVSNFEALDYYIEYSGNALVVAVGVNRLEIPTGILGSIGRDPEGEKILKFLEKENIDTSLLHVSKKSKTGYSLKIIDEKKDRIWTIRYPGANLDWPETLYNEDILKMCRAIFVSGNALADKRRSLTLKILRKARDLQKTVFLDVGPILISRESGLLANLRSLVDYWLINEEQAMEMLGTLSNSTIRYFIKRMELKAVIVKFDIEGLYVFEKSSAKKIPLNIDRKQVVDKVGLEDAYNVGLIYGMLNGYDVEGAAKIATLVAAYKLKGKGSLNLPPYEYLSSQL